MKTLSRVDEIKNQIKNYKYCYKNENNVGQVLYIIGFLEEDLDDLAQALASSEEARLKPLREALKSLIQEMEYIFEADLLKRGGLYERRLNEAKQAVGGEK